MTLKSGNKPAVYRRNMTDPMLQRVKQRISATGCMKFPAVPSLVESYVGICSKFFAASGRHFSNDEIKRARSILATTLSAVFASSPRSKIVVSFQAEPGCPLGYTVEEDISSIADAYERWIGTSNAPLFGAHPDARVWAIAQQFEHPQSVPVLDLGAGTGRNAFALAKRGFKVDAVELTPKFAEMLAEQNAANALSVRVIAQNVFQAKEALRRDYRFFFASEVVPDFRGVAELRQLFEVAADVLLEGGILLFNVHLAAHGFTPDKSSREFAQQSYSALFTPNDVREAMSGLPFELVSNDSVYRYELDNLPKDAWPPTPWFVNWVSGLDVYEIESNKCPVELRWLAFRRTADAKAGASETFDALMTALRFEAGSPHKSNRPRKFETSELRAALIRRLTRRAVASGTLTLPAIPALLGFYVGLCLDVFASLGRTLTQEQATEVKQHFERSLEGAFQTSARSNIEVTYEITMGSEVHYTVTPAPVPVARAYEEWHDNLAESLFGTVPDARLRVLAETHSKSAPMRVLDIGAGTGRNALWLASRGHHVDAIDIVPRFVQLLSAAASAQRLPIRSIEGNVLFCTDRIEGNYSLIVASGLVGDLRGSEDLRRLFELTSKWLGPGGKFLLNAHLTATGYSPDSAARQWAQQCCATCFTRSELNDTLRGLPLSLTHDCRAYDYEQTYLAEQDWPPTAAFPEWALGQHMFALPRDRSPVELWWLELTRGA